MSLSSSSVLQISLQVFPHSLTARTRHPGSFTGQVKHSFTIFTPEAEIRVLKTSFKTSSRTKKTPHLKYLRTPRLFTPSLTRVSHPSPLKIIFLCLFSTSLPFFSSLCHSNKGTERARRQRATRRRFPHSESPSQFAPVFLPLIHPMSLSMSN